MDVISLFTEYKTKMQKIADVKYSLAVLQWDQETYMPAKGDLARGRQIATLSEIAHEQFTDEKTGEPLAGASVYMADDKIGTIANTEGKYRLENG